MKKVLSLLTFVLGVAVLFAVPASAAMLDVTAEATPDYSSFVANDGEGTFSLSVDYSFYVDTATNVGLSLVGLNFDKDIFASVDEFWVSSPGDWLVNEAGIPGPGGTTTNRWEISSSGLSGTRLFKGDKLLVSAEVTLFDRMIGSTVEQSWFASAVGTKKMGGRRMCRSCSKTKVSVASTNGTVSWNVPDSAPAPVPEPATMLLFGVGLVGLVGSRIRRKQK